MDKATRKMCTNGLSIERNFPFYKDICNGTTECEMHEYLNILNAEKKHIKEWVILYGLE